MHLSNSQNLINNSLSFLDFDKIIDDFDLINPKPIPPTNALFAPLYKLPFVLYFKLLSLLGRIVVWRHGLDP